MKLRLVFYLCILLVLSGCAKPPKFELDTTEQVIEQARALDAEEYAPTEFQAAGDALLDGRALMKQGEYKSARNTLTLALEHARRAVIVTQELRAKEAAEQLAKRQAAAEKIRQAAEKARIAEEQAQRAALEAEQQAKLQTENKKKEEAPKPEPVTLVPSYKVGEGENLWTIAAQPSVYGDGLLWPLLYQANRDQIKDPRQIFPGQTLSIRRDLTPEEIEEARQKARASDIFPVSKD